MTKTNTDFFMEFSGYIPHLSKTIFNPEKIGLKYYYKDKYGLSKESNEDLMQEGALKLWESLIRYPKYKAMREKQNREIDEYNEKARIYNEKIEEQNKIQPKGLELPKMKLKKKVNIGSESTLCYLYLRSEFINLGKKTKCLKYNVELEELKYYGDRDEDDEDRREEKSINYTPEKLIDFKKKFNSLSKNQQKIFIDKYLEEKNNEQIKKENNLYNVDREILIIEKTMKDFIK